MTLELVVVDETGEEVDWIDPVRGLEADGCDLWVRNDTGEYLTVLFPGYQAIIRERKGR